MIYEVSHGKTTLRIGLREVGESAYELTIDGRTSRVDAAKTGRMIYSVIEDGHQYEAILDERGSRGFDVLIAGHLFHLDATDERQKLLTHASKVQAEGKQTISAQMPGKIVKLAVAVGESVTEGQGLVVIEAMKMENEIPSPIDGRVVEIGVREGEAVEMGATLLVVEPRA
jgi:acetyl/propionyl-CoA carboxylase alpha subunit